MGWGVAAAIAGAGVLGSLLGDKGKQRAIDYSKLSKEYLRGGDAISKAYQEAAKKVDALVAEQSKDYEGYVNASNLSIQELISGIREGRFSPEPFEQPTAQDLQVDPGYDFRVREGERGLRRQQAAQGIHQSGASLKELERFRQDQASQEYQAAYDRSVQNYQLDRQRRNDDFTRLSSLSQQGLQGQQILHSLQQHGLAQSNHFNLGSEAALSASRIDAENAIVSGQISKNQANAANLQNLFSAVDTFGGLSVQGIGAYQGNKIPASGKPVKRGRPRITITNPDRQLDTYYSY